MDKPANPTDLTDAGRALLGALAGPALLYPRDPEADWLGEPLALPADYYKVEPSPSGRMLLGWRLTDAGIAAWNAQAPA